MALAITDVDTLKKYVEGVMERSEHHAGDVGGVALALAGAIIWRKDDDEQIKVFERQGDLKNVLWVKMGGQKYAFSYNHGQQTIEMRMDSTHGAVQHSFTNSTPISDIEAIFRNL